MLLLSSVDFFRFILNPDSFMKTISMSNDFNSGQDPVSPNMCPNCLHRLSADDKSRH